MAHKQILFRSEAREKILRGATALADAIRITLGPKSKSVLDPHRGAQIKIKNILVPLDFSCGSVMLG